ncbi:DUF4254 domain-containing protein [Nocardia sp. NBC_00508]|uniref:DUF4254 domain-containing protein n=1 Tax=Nocardia sp. NBC_00508 TaxID=2975992 RepID=UPI002E805CD8|nr:DUF4254 domain-containing protein [Nocardia sp. NBC_00508]WUD67665.1 DUF4254 domain-containing protein [Nocardia sp. NBC_00508]
MNDSRSLLPSKDFVLEACTGRIRLPHPLLEAAYELAALHEARLDTPYPAREEIDRHRTRLTRHIDRWVASALPQAMGAAYLHTETVGAVVDRLARYSVLAHTALHRDTRQPEMHYAWQQLAELALGYGDLSFELTAGRRRLPTLIVPQPDRPTLGC